MDKLLTSWLLRRRPTPPSLSPSLPPRRRSLAAYDIHSRNKVNYDRARVNTRTISRHSRHATRTLLLPSQRGRHFDRFLNCDPTRTRDVSLITVTNSSEMAARVRTANFTTRRARRPAITSLSCLNYEYNSHSRLAITSYYKISEQIHGSKLKINIRDMQYPGNMTVASPSVSQRRRLAIE